MHQISVLPCYAATWKALVSLLRPDIPVTDASNLASALNVKRRKMRKGNTAIAIEVMDAGQACPSFLHFREMEVALSNHVAQHSHVLGAPIG